jgi:hypothetical protein
MLPVMAMFFIPLNPRTTVPEFFIVQTLLVRTRHVRLHRMIGWFGFVLGVAVPVLGVSTAITMARFNTVELHSTDEASGLLISFFDMTAFTIAFGLAILWRRKPEHHRRLILIATCALTSAAFARFPPNIVPPGWFYVGVDVLILPGIVRDAVAKHRVHCVYLYAFPVLVSGQAFAVYTVLYDLPYWVRIGNAILR